MVTARVPGQQVKIGPTQLLINNEWVNSISDVYDGLRLRRFETINPATGEVICEVSEADAPTPLTINSQPST
jgi:aldehyde dehydrogenase (NAD+)